MKSRPWTTCPGSVCRCSELDVSLEKEKHLTVTSDIVASSLDSRRVKNHRSKGAHKKEGKGPHVCPGHAKSIGLVGDTRLPLCQR